MTTKNKRISIIINDDTTLDDLDAFVEEAIDYVGETAHVGLIPNQQGGVFLVAESVEL